MRIRARFAVYCLLCERFLGRAFWLSAPFTTGRSILVRSCELLEDSVRAHVTMPREFGHGFHCTWRHPRDANPITDALG